MIRERFNSSKRAVQPPSAYDKFTTPERNDWIDSLQQKIQNALHPPSSPGPSRSPSPFEITEERIIPVVDAQIEIQVQGVNGVDGAEQYHEDELYNGLEDLEGVAHEVLDGGMDENDLTEDEEEVYDQEAYGTREGRGEVLYLDGDEEEAMDEEDEEQPYVEDEELAEVLYIDDDEEDEELEEEEVYEGEEEPESLAVLNGLESNPLEDQEPIYEHGIEDGLVEARRRMGVIQGDYLFAGDQPDLQYLETTEDAGPPLFPTALLSPTIPDTALPLHSETVETVSIYPSLPSPVQQHIYTFEEEVPVPVSNTDNLYIDPSLLAELAQQTFVGMSAQVVEVDGEAYEEEEEGSDRPPSGAGDYGAGEYGTQFEGAEYVQDDYMVESFRAGDEDEDLAYHGRDDEGVAGAVYGEEETEMGAGDELEEDEDEESEEDEDVQQASGSDLLHRTNGRPSQGAGPSDAIEILSSDEEENEEEDEEGEDEEGEDEEQEEDQEDEDEVQDEEEGERSIQPGAGDEGFEDGRYTQRELSEDGEEGEEDDVGDEEEEEGGAEGAGRDANTDQIPASSFQNGHASDEIIEIVSSSSEEGDDEEDGEDHAEHRQLRLLGEERDELYESDDTPEPASVNLKTPSVSDLQVEESDELQPSADLSTTYIPGAEGLVAENDAEETNAPEALDPDLDLNDNEGETYNVEEDLAKSDLARQHVQALVASGPVIEDSNMQVDSDSLLDGYAGGEGVMEQAGGEPPMDIEEAPSYPGERVPTSIQDFDETAGVPLAMHASRSPPPQSDAGSTNRLIADDRQMTGSSPPMDTFTTQEISQSVVTTHNPLSLAALGDRILEEVISDLHESADDAQPGAMFAGVSGATSSPAEAPASEAASSLHNPLSLAALGDEVLEDVIADLHDDSHNNNSNVDMEEQREESMMGQESSARSGHSALPPPTPREILLGAVKQDGPDEPASAVPTIVEHSLHPATTFTTAVEAIDLAESTVKLPDPSKPPPDTDSFQPIRAGDTFTAETPTPSVIAEPGHIHDPNSVTQGGNREDTPPILPDPSLAPVDSIREAPLTPGQYRQAILTPSVIAEPADEPIDTDIAMPTVARAESPITLPNPYDAADDSVLPSLSILTSPSLPVRSLSLEVEADTPIPLSALASAAFSKPASPTLLSDPGIAPADMDRPTPDIGVDSGNDAANAMSVVSNAGDDVTAQYLSRAATASTEEVEDEDAEASLQLGAEIEGDERESSGEGQLVLDGTRDVPARSGSENDDETGEDRTVDDSQNRLAASFSPPRASSETVAESPAPMDRETTPITEEQEQVVAPRLRHLHGSSSLLDVRPIAPIPTPQRTRSTARLSLPPNEPPITRSHCGYRKLRLNDYDLSALVLVPQCTLFDAEKLAEETCEDAGEPTSAEEEEARGHVLNEDPSILHERLSTKLHRIVGLGILDEGHVYLLSTGPGALAERAEPSSKGTPRKKRPSDELESIDEEDESAQAAEVDITPARRAGGRPKRNSIAPRTPESRSASKTRRGRHARASSRLTDDGEGAVESPAARTRSKLRSVSVAVEEEKDEAAQVVGEEEAVTVPDPDVGSARRSAGQEISAPPVDEDHMAGAGKAEATPKPFIQVPASESILTGLVASRRRTRQSIRRDNDNETYRPNDTDVLESEDETAEQEQEDEAGHDQAEEGEEGQPVSVPALVEDRSRSATATSSASLSNDEITIEVQTSPVHNSSTMAVPARRSTRPRKSTAIRIEMEESKTATPKKAKRKSERAGKGDGTGSTGQEDVEIVDDGNDDIKEKVDPPSATRTRKRKMRLSREVDELNSAAAGEQSAVNVGGAEEERTSKKRAVEMEDGGGPVAALPEVSVKEGSSEETSNVLPKKGFMARFFSRRK